MSKSLLSVPIIPHDLEMANHLRQQGAGWSECLPLAVALRRMFPTTLVLTRRFVQVDDVWWEPCRTTREAERQWAHTGIGAPYLARLEQWPSCLCGHPRRNSASLCRHCQTQRLMVPLRSLSASEQITPVDLHGPLRAVAERIQSGFANWPSRTWTN